MVESLNVFYFPNQEVETPDGHPGSFIPYRRCDDFPG